VADLSALLASLDDDDRKAIEDALAEKDQLIKEKGRTERDLRLATDAKLRQTYPRAFKAYERRRLDFGDATTDAEVTAILKAKGEELAELGVPIGEPAPAGAAPVDAQVPEPAPDPAAAFGIPVGGGQPAGSYNATQVFLESMKADSPTDRAQMVEAMVELNKKGARDEIDQLTEMLGSKHGPRAPWDGIF
jgi:hypothetical protein